MCKWVGGKLGIPAWLSIMGRKERETRLASEPRVLRRIPWNGVDRERQQTLKYMG